MEDLDPLVLGSRESEFLAVEPLCRTHPEAADPWDGDWLHVRVTARAGGFAGEVSGELRCGELAAFARELAALEGALPGEARFTTMEGWLALRLVGDRTGHVRIEGALRDAPGTGNLLRFTLERDRTDLASWRRALDRINAAYPAR